MKKYMILFCGAVVMLFFSCTHTPGKGWEPTYGQKRKRMQFRHGMGKGMHGPSVPASADSIAKGKKLFAENCVSCHGASGEGNGPAAKGLEVKPANLKQISNYHHDHHFFMQISMGGRSTEMPAWRDKFTNAQIWHLTNYIRTL